MFLVLIFFLSIILFCYYPPLCFLQNKFSFLSLPADCTDQDPMNRCFSMSNFTIIPLLFSQLLKPGLIQVPWDLVSHSITVKGFTASGTLCFGQKSKRSEKIMM